LDRADPAVPCSTRLRDAARDHGPVDVIGPIERPPRCCWGRKSTAVFSGLRHAPAAAVCSLSK
jgi:hypothetical protein